MNSILDSTNCNQYIRKRGRKRLADQQWRICDEKETEEMRKRNNQTLEDMLKSKKTSIKNAEQEQYSQQYYQAYASHQQQAQVEVPVIYTKERIENAIRKYESMYREYEQCGITLRVKHYLKMLPEVSQKIKLYELDDEHTLKIVGEISQMLMMDEFEIINWIKFIDRFDFKRETFAMDLFFIALATKLLLNNQKQKEPFEIYLSKTNQQFFYFNHWIAVNNSRFYQDIRDSLITHRIFKKLNKTLMPKFFELKDDTPTEIEIEPDFNMLVEEIINQEEESKKQPEINDEEMKLANDIKKFDLFNGSKNDRNKLDTKAINSLKEALDQLERNQAQNHISHNLQGTHSNNHNSNGAHATHMNQNLGRLISQSPLMAILHDQLSIVQTPANGIDFLMKDSMIFPQNDLFGFSKGNHKLKSKHQEGKNHTHNTNQDNNSRPFQQPITRQPSKKDQNNNVHQRSQINNPGTGFQINQGLYQAANNLNDSLIHFGNQELQDFFENEDEIEDFEKNLLN